jgi:hypothetical protein
MIGKSNLSEANPAFLSKSSGERLFFQAKKRASVGRCSLAGKNSLSPSGLFVAIGAKNRITIAFLEPIC